MTALNRRSFIVGSGAIASGGLAIGLQMAGGPAAAQAVAAGDAEVNVWVVVKPDDTCVIRIAR